MRVLAYADSNLFSGAEAVHCDLVRGLAASSALALRCAAPLSNQRLAGRLEEVTGEVPLHVPAQRPFGAAFDLYSPSRRAAVQGALDSAPYDVLLVNLPSAEYGGTPLIAWHPATARIVGLLHVPGSFNELGFRLGWLRDRLAHRVMSRLDALCVVAESAADTARSWVRNNVPISVVPLSIPRVERISREEARERLGLPSGKTVVGIAGRVSFKQKGQDTFVEAATRLLDPGLDLHFAVAGDGRDLMQLRKKVGELGLNGKMSLLGHVEPVGWFLSAVDLVAIPSRFEGLPLIALEALAAGVPGVAANIDGLRDVWPPQWQVKPGDPVALEKGIKAVIESTPAERLRLIALGRERMAASTSPNPASILEAAILEATR